MVLNPENYCIPHRHRLLVQTTKQPLSNFDPQKPWKYKQLWGLRPDPSCLKKTKCNEIRIYILSQMYKEKEINFWACKNTEEEK